MSEAIFRRWGWQFAIAGAVVLYLLPLMGMDIRTYLTLTIAGLAMGMMLFLVASGLSLIFGLMDVINFAHGVCFAYGAYVAFSVFRYLRGWVEADSVFQNFMIFFIAIAAAIVVVGFIGIIIERVLVRRVYGSHLFQILITFGGMVVLTELIRIIWGPNDEVMPVPLKFQGNWDIFDIIVLRYPIIAIMIGLLVYGIIQIVLKKTKVGKIVRAGVEDPEMVQAMGHNIFLFFTVVFAAGAGLAAVGGLAMAIFNLQVYPDMGDAYLIFAFIVVIIGGLGKYNGVLGRRLNCGSFLQLCGIPPPSCGSWRQYPHHGYCSSHSAYWPFPCREVTRKRMAEQTPVQIFRTEERQRRYKSGTFILRIGVLVLFLLVPFVFPSFKTVDLALKIMIFAVLVASFDILLGYTGILSFGHVMFFGVGAYSVAMLIGKYGSPSYVNLVLGFLIAVGITSALAVLVSFLSLRVRAIFFAMVTLAIAEFAIILATKLSGFTGGEDGIIMSMPGIFKVSFTMGKFLGLEITGRLVTYYFILLVCLILFLLMIRFIHSPLGRVMQAIRDNEPRAEAVGYKTFIFKTISICFGCLVATILGGLYVMWVGYANPESVLGIPIMLDVLLMVIVGGMGTLYGGLAGAAFLKIAYTFLPDLQNFAKGLFPGAHFLHTAMERWHLIFGVLFILVVFFFPKGIIGSVQDYMARRGRSTE